MFENPGKKIKNFAEILFWLDAIGFVILAFVFGWSEEYLGYFDSSYTTFNPELFFTLLLGGPLVSYINSLFLTAIGDLVQSSHDTREMTKALLESKCDVTRNEKWETTEPNLSPAEENSETNDNSYRVLPDKSSEQKSTSISTSGPEIPGWMHMNNEKLTNIVIPSDIVSIGNGAFSGCKNLECVTIPTSVKHIGASVFLGCPKLTSIRYLGSEADWELVEKGNYWKSEQTEIVFAK